MGRKRGYKCPPETLDKMRVASAGRTHTPEARAKIGAAHRGKVVSAEARAKMSAAAHRRYGTEPEMAAPRKRGRKAGYICSPETRAKMNEHRCSRHGGWVVPDEHRGWYRKMREAGFPREACRVAIMQEMRT